MTLLTPSLSKKTQRGKRTRHRSTTAKMFSAIIIYYYDIGISGMLISIAILRNLSYPLGPHLRPLGNRKFNPVLTKTVTDNALCI